MSKLLAISCFVPPVLTPRSLQVARTLKHLGLLGWDCTVLALDPASLRAGTNYLDPALQLTYQNAFKVIHTRSPENAWLLRRLRRIIQKLPIPGGSVAIGSKILWGPSAIRAGLRLLRQRGEFSVLVSFAMPRSSHLVAYALSRATGIPWVAHFSDPWGDNPYFEGGPLSRWLLGRLERMVIARADVIVFVTKRTADMVMAKYPPSWKRRVRVIPHCYDWDSYSAELETTSQSLSRLRLVYTGSFYTRRGPEFLLQALALLNQDRNLSDRLEVLLVGSRDPEYEQLCERLGLGGLVQFGGRCSHVDALRAIARAGACLVLDASSRDESVFLPCKVADYLMFRKPILGLTPRRGETADLLQRLGCPVVEPDDVRGIAAAIDRLLQTWEAGRLSVSPAYLRVAQEFDASSTAQLMDAALRLAQERHAVTPVA